MEKVITSTYTVREQVWRGLRRLAEIKAAQAGGRPSASGVIERLVLAELARLDAEQAGGPRAR